MWTYRGEKRDKKEGRKYRNRLFGSSTQKVEKNLKDCNKRYCTRTLSIFVSFLVILCEVSCKKAQKLKWLSY